MHSSIPSYFVDMDNSTGKVSVLLVVIVSIMSLSEAQPTFTFCPDDQAVAPTAGETSLVVDFTFPTAEDSTGNTLKVSCNQHPGDSFPLGKTTVTCTATDGTNTEKCTFLVKVGEGEGCTRGVNKCTCRGNDCTCLQGYTGVDCAIEDATNCTDGDTPSASCVDTCPSTCGCETGWQGPNCDDVDDGSQCNFEGNPPQCVLCFTGDAPPCICELGWRGVICEEDYIPPFFVSCLNDTTEMSDIGEDTVEVTWEDPKAGDNTEDDPVVTCKPESGSRFYVGMTQVICTATDNAIPVNNTVSDCIFSVTVTDNKSPDMTCPDTNTWNVDSATAGAAVVWSPPPLANDTVDGLLNVTCTDDSDNVVESGDMFAVAVTIVTCSAADKSGNIASCDFNITVVDNEGPNVECPASSRQTVEPGRAYAPVVWSPLPSAEDAVDGMVTNVTCVDQNGKDAATGGRFLAGDTRITCSAVDSVGNVRNCSFTITVIDNQSPIMTCVGNISQDVDPGSALATVEWPTIPSANDTVDGPLGVTCKDDSGNIVTSGDMYQAGVTVVTCEASDSNGNKGNCSFTITVTECGGVEVCQNGGEFIESFCNCVCPSPYTGKTCAECKECVNGNAQNDTTCVCQCFNSYQGPLCDVCPDDILCANDGVYNESSCRCICPLPWSGPTCSECSADTVCQNGGEFITSFCNCTCPVPFTGQTCTECEPCQNEGSYQNKFTCFCECPDFHTDPLCTVCPLEFVCLNGGTKNEATCSCKCSDSWRDQDCSEPVPNLPDDEYPVSPFWGVVEKMVFFEIAVISPVFINKECHPGLDKFSAACISLVAEFKISVEIEYMFVTGFSRVVINQDDLRAGSVVVPHEVIYNYDEMTPTTRGISANGLYEKTVGKAVERGQIGTIKVTTACKECKAPHDTTNMCDEDPPKCAAGLMLATKAEGDACYYVCQSKCKVDTTYCGEGTCHQELGSEDISCSCPQSSKFMYSGNQCQLRIQLVWVYVGVGVGGFLLLLLLLILSAFACRRNGETKKLKEQDDEEEERPLSNELIGELAAYHNNGYTRNMYLCEDSRNSSRTSGMLNRDIKPTKNGEVEGAGALQSSSAERGKYEREEWGGGQWDAYFWGNLTLPTKEDTEMIPMTSETGRF